MKTDSIIRKSLGSALIMVTLARADMPQRISHQGVVAVSGQRWSGTGLFRFAIVNGAGKNLWTNDGSGVGSTDTMPTSAESLTVTAGVYHASLGDVSAPLNMPAIPFEALSGGDARIRVWFDDGANGVQLLSPDQTLVSVPYAFNGVPPGTIMAYGGVAAPPGWLTCEGQTVSRTTYPALFAAVGTAWGAGDGSTTFHTPDLRGFFLRGVDGVEGSMQPLSNRDPDSDSRQALFPGGHVGNRVGTWQFGATKKPNGFAISSESHSHNILMSVGGAGNGCPLRGDDGLPCNGTSGHPTDAASHSHATTGWDAESRPLNAAVLYIIKY